MAKTFKVDIVTPEAVIWSGEAELLSARTTEGDIGILADHEATMSALSTGAVQIHTGGSILSVGIHGGFLQIYRNQVTLLTDRAEMTEGDRDEAMRLAAELRELEEAEAEFRPTP